jgi:hypothetical protein
MVACRKCNSEKRRDDALPVLKLAGFGWASFLSHDGTRCDLSCRTCGYWKSIWALEAQRKERLENNLQTIRLFRSTFPEFERVAPSLRQELPPLVTKLYSDCQTFAEEEIRSLLVELVQRRMGEPEANAAP